jgi:hypothetical protein
VPPVKSFFIIGETRTAGIFAFRLIIEIKAGVIICHSLVSRELLNCPFQEIIYENNG